MRVTFQVFSGFISRVCGLQKLNLSCFMLLYGLKKLNLSPFEKKLINQTFTPFMDSENSLCAYRLASRVWTLKTLNPAPMLTLFMVRKSTLCRLHARNNLSNA